MCIIVFFILLLLLLLLISIKNYHIFGINEMVILFVVVAPVQFVGIHFTVLQGNEQPIYPTSSAYYEDSTLS